MNLLEVVTVKPDRMLNIILFILELGTLLFFIPLLIYLAEYSFKMPGIGLLVGIGAVIHYYIYRWYHDRGSLVYFGLCIIVGSLGAVLAWFLDVVRGIFFPAMYLFEYSKLFLPKLAQSEPNTLYLYYVFLTGIVYISIGRFVVCWVCNLLGLSSFECGQSKSRVKKDMAS